MAKDLTALTEAELEKKIKAAKLTIERNTGRIKEASERKLAKLEAELESRGKKVEKEVKEDAKKVEKAVEKAADKVEKKVEEAVEKPKSKRGRPKGTTSKKSTAKKSTAKKSEPTEKFELTIDGKVYTFADLKSKQECEKAMKAVQARYKEVKEHRAAQKEGIEKASTIPVTKRIADSFTSIAKKAVAEVPKTKIDKKPTELKAELDELEKAFENLFDKLGKVMGREIPKSQRKQIMDILTKFEAKVEKNNEDAKKEKATKKVRKEDGGLAGTTDAGLDSGVGSASDVFNADNSWSYISLM